MATRKIVPKKTAAKKTTTSTKSAPKRRSQKSAAGRISVRMYRQGLGDCFLITFPRKSGGPFRMLIDCGIVLGAEDAGNAIKKVVADLATTAPEIDVLVLTHEHWDHVSGFSASQEQDAFKGIKFGQVWVAWTENPVDPLSKKLRAERRSAEQALRMAVAHIGLAGDRAMASRVDSLVGFFGAATGSTEAAMDYAKGRAPDKKPRYCQPGEPPIEIPGLPGVRFWVLGPPKDEKLIKKSNPGKNEGYGLDAGPGGSQSFLIAALARGMAATLDSTLDPDSCLEDPFDNAYSIPLERARHLPFFDRKYFGASTDESLYEKLKAKRSEPEGKPFRDQSWRRIDAAWLGASETMALQLDSATNNTSLVLAIEIVDTREVLLFPGDAQAGNWLSWQDLKWTLRETGKKETVTGPDLLARTIFYKVGHHGSHNATLKAKGLELMVNEDLVAMVPVNHKMAVKKGWGRMPLPDLMSRLREKTHGRALSIDDKVTKHADLAGLKPDNVSAAEWKRFTDRVEVTDLYYEIAF